MISLELYVLYQSFYFIQVIIFLLLITIDIVCPTIFAWLDLWSRSYFSSFDNHTVIFFLALVCRRERKMSKTEILVKHELLIFKILWRNSRVAKWRKRFFKIRFQIKMERHACIIESWKLALKPLGVTKIYCSSIKIKLSNICSKE